VCGPSAISDVLIQDWSRQKVAKKPMRIFEIQAIEKGRRMHKTVNNSHFGGFEISTPPDESKSLLSTSISGVH